MPRGLQAYREQATVATQRREARFANQILLKNPADKVLGRFMGIIGPLPVAEYPETDISNFDEGQLAWLAAQLGVGIHDKKDEFIERLVNRYKQVEPFVYAQHFVQRATKGQQYTPCGNSLEPKVQDVGCLLMNSGDKGISLSDQAAFSFLPHRQYHSWEQKGSSKKGFAYCEGKNCKYCARAMVPKWDGMKYWSFATMHSDGVIACADRVRERCVSCHGMGKIEHVSWSCPDCGSVVALIEEQSKANCHTCKKKVVPQEVVACSRGCEAPRRCMLYDVDVLVTRVTGGTKTTYSFNEQLPAEPLPNDRLLSKLPVFESVFKTPSVELQCQRMGVSKNPFTGAPVMEAPEDSTSYEEDHVEDGPPVNEEDIPF